MVTCTQWEQAENLTTYNISHILTNFAVNTCKLPIEIKANSCSSRF